METFCADYIHGKTFPVLYSSLLKTFGTPGGHDSVLWWEKIPPFQWEYFNFETHHLAVLEVGAAASNLEGSNLQRR